MRGGGIEEWWQQCKEDVKDCSEMELSSYTYDPLE